MRRDEELLPSGNHFKQASLTGALPGELRKGGFRRLAGNIFVSNSSRDFWTIKNGKIVRLTDTEVDNGEKVAAAPADNPGGFLRDVLADLTF